MRAGSRTCECARDYVSKCRLRLLHHIPKAGEKILDMASGPIQYPEYLEFSKGFTKRYCVDLSSQALKSAEKKLGEHGVYLCGSFFELEFAPETFDCAISLHTIYHMDRDLQELAVRKLIAVCTRSAGYHRVFQSPKPDHQIGVFPKEAEGRPKETEGRQTWCHEQRFLFLLPPTRMVEKIWRSS